MSARAPRAPSSAHPEIVVTPGGDESRKRVRRRTTTRPGWASRVRRRIRWRWVLLGFSAFLVLLAADFWFEYAPALQALKDGKDRALQAKQLLTGDLPHLSTSRITQATSLLQQAHDDFGSKSDSLQGGILIGVADHLPWLSTQVDGARALRTAGSTGAQFAIDLTTIVGQVATPKPGTPSSPFQQVVTVADSNRSQLARAATDLDAFQTALNAVPTGSLWGPLASARTTVVSEGRKIVAAARPGLEILFALPTAVGPGDHRYLLLLENPGEERPGGGFIGAVGEVDFHDGSISSETFQGGEAFTGLTPTSIKAPAPLDDNLFHGTPMDLEDANWSPDFPTAVGQVTNLYQLATGHTVDGVVSVDPVALSYILQVLGPAHVPGYPSLPITASNAMMELNDITNKARPGDPGKVFLPPFGRLMTDEILHAPIGQLPVIANALQRGAAEKHVVLWFRDAHLESLVNGADFGGVLATPLSDSLMVNDANLSGTKGDLFVTRHFALAATVASDGTVRDQLTLTYHNPVVTGSNVNLVPNSGGDYRDYIQVVVPETATLGEMSVSINEGKPTSVAPQTVTYDLQREVIAYWLVVPRGGSATVSVTYSGPFADISQTPEEYVLAWEKQINAFTWPIAVTVTMPGGSVHRWSSDLSVDRSWQVSG